MFRAFLDNDLKVRFSSAKYQPWGLLLSAPACHLSWPVPLTLLLIQDWVIPLQINTSMQELTAIAAVLSRLAGTGSWRVKQHIQLMNMCVVLPAGLS